MPARPLKDVGVLITRPLGQGEALKAKLEAKGAEVLHFPTIEIAPMARSPELERSLEPMDSYHYAIFISPNAVEYAAELVDLSALPAKLKVAAIGPGTARALTARGRKPDILPRDGANSEALLRLKSLNKVAGKRILIVRGLGGRELLAETLEERGAYVEYAEVYRRNVPRIDQAELTQWFRAGKLDAIMVSSRDALLNLERMLSPGLTPYFKSAQLVVPSARMVKLATALGARRRPVIAGEATDAVLVNALVNWWKSHGKEQRKHRREHEHSA